MTSNSPLNNPNHTAALTDSPNPAVEQQAEKVTPALSQLPGWRFWAPLALQAALIVAIPAQDAFTYVTGRQVTLQTAPVDPYDLLRGYSQTLSYEISRPETLQQLPGGEDFFNAEANGAKEIYVVLEAPNSANNNPPEPWRPVQVSASPPTNLANNQVALKGEYRRRRVLYGLETYYMPEDQRNQINGDIGQVQRQNQQAFVVEVRIDGQGNSVPVSLWVSDRNYRF
ncbi:MAG: GDYXXLXY domain-containing protein [Leptolyngbyaceae cyanobacterium MO_188.B28]|nr:GDYXXLXY domain-containing protein [Leptolyngbyaceae cyanobacterium MO_188.B28]